MKEAIYFWLWTQATKQAARGELGFWFHLWMAYTFLLAALKHLQRSNHLQMKLHIENAASQIEEAWYSVTYL